MGSLERGRAGGDAKRVFSLDTWILKGYHKGTLASSERREEDITKNSDP